MHPLQLWIVRLSQVDVTPAQLNAVFFTHMHSDHMT
jgi:ribonuclease BN (tRNA processing enzyme)